MDSDDVLLALCHECESILADADPAPLLRDALHGAIGALYGLARMDEGAFAAVRQLEFDADRIDVYGVSSLRGDLEALEHACRPTLRPVAQSGILRSGITCRT